LAVVLGTEGPRPMASGDRSVSAGESDVFDVGGGSGPASRAGEE
jgi:hypothetical protein